MITGVGFDGSISEVEFAQMARHLGAGRAFADGLAFKPTAVSSPDRTVQYAAGQAYAHGVLITSDSAINLQHASVSSGSRWDTVALRIDWQPPGGTVTPVIITGTATKIPTLTYNNPGVQYDLPLALVRVQAGQSLVQEIEPLHVYPSKETLARSLLAFPNPHLGLVVQLVDGAGVLGPRYVRRLDASGNPGWVSTTQAPRFECRLFDPAGEVSIPSDYTWSATYSSPAINTLGCDFNAKCVVIPRDGVYLLNANWQWKAGSGAGQVKAMIWRNPTSNAMPGAGLTSPAGGAGLRNATYAWTNSIQDVEATKVFPLNAGDRLMFCTYQNTGQTQKIIAPTTAGGYTSSGYISIDLLGDI